MEFEIMLFLKNVDFYLPFSFHIIKKVSPELFSNDYTFQRKIRFF